MFDLFIYFSTKILPPKFNISWTIFIFILNFELLLKWPSAISIYIYIYIAKFDNIKNVKVKKFKHTSIL
jgi:hypothetical protein